MKKILCILLITFSSLSVYAASYKVNTHGQVVSPSGNVQQNSSVLTPNDVYNNYYAQNYVNTKQALSGSVGTINIVMDYSGSMSYWITVAKKSMATIVSQLPSTTKIGFRAFGHENGMNPYTPIVNKVKSIVKDKNGNYKLTAKKSPYLGSVSGSCSATSQIVPVKPYDAYSLLNGMNSIDIGGSTPLTLALEQAVDNDFLGLAKNSPKKIILITDGGENCGGDPCAFAKSLVSSRNDISIDVVLVSSDSSGLVCLANTTGGKVYNPTDVGSFVDSLIDSMQTIPNVPEQETPSQYYEFIGN